MVQKCLPFRASEKTNRALIHELEGSHFDLLKAGFHERRSRSRSRSRNQKSRAYDLVRSESAHDSVA